jgi:hypothetical protein
LVARENAAADLFADLLSSSKAANVPKPTSVGINILPNQDRLWRRAVGEMRKSVFYGKSAGAARPSGITVAAPGSTVAAAIAVSS